MQAGLALILVGILLLGVIIAAASLLRTFRQLMVVLGLVAWIVAFVFGLYPTVRADRVPITRAAGDHFDPLQSYDVANGTGAAAALGFALAGGMCFIAASLSSGTTGGKREGTTGPASAADRGRNSGSSGFTSTPPGPGG
jgi:energy-coupling factor transporter transmembrane protein EcfT